MIVGPWTVSVGFSSDMLLPREKTGERISTPPGEMCVSGGDKEDMDTYVWPHVAPEGYRQQRIAAGGDSSP